MLLNHVAEKTFANFEKSGWPNCLLVTGENYPEKLSFLYDKIAAALHHSRHRTGDSYDKTLQLMKDGSHPDFFYFQPGKIRIGSHENPEPGSVRYLLQHFMPYAPKYSRKKFIFFADAAQINDEAESALLKSLEEPPEGFHFVLSCDTADSIKETIVSRSLQLHLAVVNPEDAVPESAWERFWYLNNLNHGIAWQTAVEKNWLTIMETFYDELSFSRNDYPAFDKLLITDFKKYFSKEKTEIQTQLLEFCLKPLQFAIRDSVVAGPVIELAPFRLPAAERKTLLTMHNIIQLYFNRLKYRVFGNIPPNVTAVTASLISHLLPLWGTAFRR